MYLDTRNNTNTIIHNIPQQHTFVGSGQLGDGIAVADGCTVGDFDAWDEVYHIAEGFLPFGDTKPEYNTKTQLLEDGGIVTAEDGNSAYRDWAVVDKSPEQLATELQSIKETRQSEVTALRDLKTKSGFVFGGVRYDTKSSSLQNINGMLTRILLTDEFPEGFQGWISEDNTIVQMTVEEFKDFAMTACDYIATLYAVARYHKDSMETLETVEDVLSYDIEAGW